MDREYAWHELDRLLDVIVADVEMRDRTEAAAAGR
jgi:hypothetical protein